MNQRIGLNFADEQACIADIERLQRGYTPVGAWTLPQTCWHCWVLVKDAFHSPNSTAVSPEQEQAQGFIKSVVANGWPEGRLEAPPMAAPPPDAGPQAVADLMGVLRTMATYPHTHVDHFFFGAVEIAPFRRFVLNHVAHHLDYLVPTVHRRSGVKYANENEMIADIARLRRGYTKGGNWSLAQIAWHINLAFPMPMVAEATQPELTEAQVVRQARWDYYIAHGKAPEGFEAPPELLPPETCNDADVDGLIQRLHDLAAFKGQFVRAAAGVMPIERARGFMLSHGALHLSCLHPTHRKREHLSFATIAGIITDVGRLRRGYVAAGNWSLEQVCWHLAMTIPHPPQTGDTSAPVTPEMEKRQAFFETLARSGPPPGFEAPAAIVPPAHCDASAIDEYLKRLEALDAFDAPAIQTDAFGVVSTAKLKQLTLGHAARHLAFLRPIHGPREELHFANEDDAIADIQTLRRGYEQVGGWSLPQICWHLNITMQGRMKPGPFEPNTPEQDARKPIFDRILATGQLPKGIQAPTNLIAPADAGDEAIDACIATLTAFKNHQGPFTPHRLFGHAHDDLVHKQNLIHVAHHLAHLVPTSPTKQ